MHRIDTPTAQKDKFGLGKNGFTDGDPTTGTPATDLNEEICDALQEEVCTVIERLGIRLDKNQHDQLYQAMQKLSEKEANNVKIALVDAAPVDLNTLKKLAKALHNDPKFAETCNVLFAKKASEEPLKVGRLNVESSTGDTILNLGGTNGSSGAEFAYVRRSKRTQVHDTNTKTTVSFPQQSGELALKSEVEEVDNYPVGAPIPWPQAIPPKGYFICNGEPFDKVNYPKLALAYPSGRLPDLRGEFIRGLSAGRKNIDVGRTVLSEQEDAFQNFTGRISGIQFVGQSDAKGIFKMGRRTGNSSIGSGTSGVFTVDSAAHFQSGLRAASETRPRNIAFLYIVRAA